MCRRHPRCHNPTPLDCEYCERLAEQGGDYLLQFSRQEWEALADYLAAKEYGGGRG